MPKNPFYFSHDYNARHDKKIAALVREFKSSGYGVFWCAAEILHEEGGEVELDDLCISSIAKDLNEDFELVKNILERCVSTFKLFNISEHNILTANRVKNNLQKRKDISEIRSKAGKNGAIAKHLPSKSVAIAKQMQAKERKGNKRKVNKIVFNTMPLPENFNGLPEIKIGAVIELMKILKQIDVSKSQINGLWSVFKIQNLTGKKYYGSEDDVYSHFINWVKTQNIDKSTLPNVEKKMVF
jgi:hypothetical protein